MRIRILFLLALMVHQSWTHPSYSYDSSVDAVTAQQQNNDNPERDGESSKRIIGSSVVTSVSVILNGNEPEFTDALGMKVPKPQLPHLQVASPINLLNPDRYEFYTFDDNGDLVKRLMTMQEIQSIVANGDGDGPTIIHSAPIDDRDPEKNVQDIVKSVQSVLNREVESNKNSSDIQPILDTPDVSSSWSMILPAIFGNTGGDIFPQNKPQQVVMTPDSDVVEATTKATSNKRKPSSKPKPHKKKTNNRRKTTTKRVSTTTPIPEQEVEATEILESSTRKVFINNQEVVHATEAGEPQQGENFAKRPPGIHRKPVSAHGGAKRPQSTKQKNKTKRPITTSTTTTTTTTTPEPTTTTTTTTTPEPTTTTTTTTPEPTTTTTTTPEPTTTTTTSTTPAPTTTTTEAPVITTPAGATEAAIIPTEGTIVKVKPQKKRKKPTRKPSTTGPVIDVTTERHIGYLHKRKQTTPRPNIHHKPYYPADESYVPVSHKHKVPPTTSTTTTTTTPAPTTTTTTTTPAPTTTTTTTTTSAPTTTSTTTTTTTPAPTTTTTTSTTTTTTTPAPTTTTTTTTTPAPTTTTTTTTTPVPTTTTTTTPFTFATYRPTPPITSTPSYAPYRPRPTTSTTPVPTSTSGSYYAPDLIQQQLLEGYGIHSEDFAPSLKKENIPMPGKDKEKEEDLNTKISFDQILQSLKEESATDNDMQASESEEVQLPAKLPPSAYPSVANLEVENETPAPIHDLPMTIASTNFESYDDMDELTSRPITQGKPTNSDESTEISDSGDNIKNNDQEEESPVVIITSRPQHHTSNKTVVPLIPDIPEVTTVFFESDYTTEKFNDQEKEQDLELEQEPETEPEPEPEQESTTLRKEDTVQDDDSAHVVKFEPLYADIAEPVVTTFTTTTPEPVSTTITDDFVYTDEEESTTNQPTTLPPMESIMQKIDSIISMSLKANGTLEMNNGQLPQSLPHMSIMTMKDYKTQAATVASILEDNNTSQSNSETTVMNSSETKDEIQFLLSDVINQMTHSQQPTMMATTMPNIVAPKPHSNLNSNSSPNQDETAQRLSNFAQINPALQINAGALIQAPLREPTTVDESIEKVTSVPEDNSQPQEEDDVAPTTAVPSVENEPSFVLISQAGGDDSSASLNSAEEEKIQLTTTPAIEISTQRVFQTTQRGYISSEEISKEKLSSEEKVDLTTTIRPDSISEDSTEEDGSEQMIIITSRPDVPEEEKSTEIPGETVVVLSDSDMEESSETPEFTTVVPSLQTSSHLLEGEDPYIKLGEIGAKPTVQSLAQMIYGQNSSPNQLPLANEPVEIKEKSEEAEQGKIDQNPVIQESDVLQKIDYSESAEPIKIDGKLDELLTGEQLSDKIPENSTPASVETQSIPELIQIVQSGKKPMMNMAQLALEQALMHATKVPVDFEDEDTTTVQSVGEKETSSTPTTSTSELPQLLETTQAPLITEEKTSPTQAPTSTIPTKKIPNTLKPVSYFNKQPSLLNPDQKFNAFQAAQQRPVVRPASLSNLKMPQSTVTRAPVKLEPSPVGSIGLEASVSGLDDDIQQFAQLCNELAFTYWRSITSEKISSARSLIISPFALTSMLSMVFLGARGSTSGEMNEVLKLDDMVTFNPHLVFKNITDSVEKATDSDIASSAFVREAFSDRANGKILQFFKEKTQQFYSGHVEEVNFHVVNDIIRRRTNLLVKRHTMGKVLEYLRTNSVWVNGPLATISANLYQTDCSRASINDRDGEMFFQVHPSIRQRRLVPIPAVLYRSGFTAGYEPNLDATVVAFGRTFDTVSTIYVMPGQQGPIAPADSLDILEKNLIETAFTKHAWRDLMTSLMERQNLEVQLPRFSHRSFVNASMGLQKMGLKGLFKSDLADLRGLTGLAAKDIYLSDMIQINTFSTCAEEKIGEHHHVEMYPAPPIRKRNKDVRENEAPEADSSESVIDFGSIVQDTAMARAFYDDLLDPKFLELPLPLRPRQARIPDAPRLRFDRPFLYFVRHNPTGMILFMGRFNPRLLP